MATQMHKDEQDSDEAVGEESDDSDAVEPDRVGKVVTRDKKKTKTELNRKVSHILVLTLFEACCQS